MIPRNIVATVAGIAVTACAAVTASPALAAPDGPGNKGRVLVEQTANVLPKYTDRQVLEFIVAGQGIIAKNHPDLLTYLGFAPDKPETPKAALNAFMRDYLAADPDFHETVVLPLQSGDPEQVDAALRQFTVEVQAVVEAKLGAAEGGTPGEFEPMARGWFWQGAYVAIYANAVGVANVVGYANVAAATLAVTLIYAWYLEDGAMTGSDLEKQTFIVRLSDALKS